MSLELWTGAQSGVDLGAALTALSMDTAIAGFMPADGHNEDGPIPDAVAMHLTRHDRTNPAARTRANVDHADAALVIVEDRRRAGATRGTALTIRLCEAKGWGDSLVIVDPASHTVSVASWVSARLGRWHACGNTRPLRLLVAGPRRSLWPDGEREAARFVRAVIEAARGV